MIVKKYQIGQALINRLEGQRALSILHHGLYNQDQNFGLNFRID